MDQISTKINNNEYPAKETNFEKFSGIQFQDHRNAMENGINASKEMNWPGKEVSGILKITV